MKILLAADDSFSGQEFLSIYPKQIKKQFTQFTIRTVGYAKSSNDLELSWCLDSCSSPIFGPANKEKIEQDIIDFAPHLILNWNEKITQKLAEKYWWEIWNCCGSELLSILKTDQIPLKIKKSWNKNGIKTPISFWPFLLNLNLGENFNFCLPILKEQEVLSKKGYLYCVPNMKIEIESLPKSKDDIFLSNGSTTDLYRAFLLQVPKIFIFSDSPDPNILSNILLAEKYNLARSWKGEYDVDFDEIPEIDYSKLKSFDEEKNILNLIQAKYSSSSENGD